MNFNCTLSLNILLVLVLGFAKTYFCQECNSDGFNCISCTDYQKCSASSSKEPIISCKNGKNCADFQLKQCQVKLNCYALNECTQPGIFPDVMVDSNYYVCLDDASSGFLKYEFSCPEGNFFDQPSLTCIPRSVTSPITDDPTSVVTTIDPITTGVSTDTTLPLRTTDLTSSSVTNPSTLNTDTTLSDPTFPSTYPTSPTTPTPTDPTFPSTSPTTPTPTDPTFPSTFPTTTDPTTSTFTDLTSPSISTKPLSSTTMPTTPAPFACITPGIFSNPGNCKMYYRCSTSLKAFFYICPGNSYFNENILKCSLIITPACQEQILRNSSSIPPPVTTPTTTTISTTISLKPTYTTPFTITSLKPITTPFATTSIKPITTPFATTSIKPITTTPFISTSTATSPIFTTSTQATTTTTTNSPWTIPMSCTTAGIFANPLDCRTYYRCSLSGKIFRYVCPGNTYFNEITQRCSLIITSRCKSLI